MVLIFVDVDGPLIPFGPRPSDRAPSHQDGHPLLHRLDPRDGRRLLALGAELVWATTWGDDANEVIAPRIGLPALPVVDWPDSADDPVGGVHWKTAGLVDRAAGRPFIWIDDEITDLDRRWVSARHPGPALLQQIDPFTGLTEADFAFMSDWVELAGE